MTTPNLSLTAIKLGDSATPSKNFIISVPDIPDGTLTIERADGTDVLTIDATGRVKFPSSSVPAFSAYQSAPQASSTAYTKVAFQTEQFDTNSAFDSVSNYRFQPKVAGYYFLNGSVAASNAASSLVCAIYVNGVQEKAGDSESSSIMYQTSVSALIYLNGATDYAELWAACSVAQNWQASKQGTYFQGFLVRDE